MHRIIAPAAVAAPAANYAHARLTTGATRWLHTSGVVPIAPDGSVPASIEAQAEVIWENLLAKKVSISSVSPDRWDAGTFVSAEREAGKSVTSMAGWLPHIDRFDFAYFKMSKKEALEMDPQQRMAIEVSTEALVDSGIELTQLQATRTGVFAGAGIAEFMGMSFR